MTPVQAKVAERGIHNNANMQGDPAPLFKLKQWMPAQQTKVKDKTERQSNVG